MILLIDGSQVILSELEPTLSWLRQSETTDRKEIVKWPNVIIIYDNRRSAAESINFCRTFVLSYVAARREKEKMITDECINKRDIPLDIKKRLPVLTEEKIFKCDCKVCVYYGGLRHCMLTHCICDDKYGDNIYFHPELKKIIPRIQSNLAFDKVEDIPRVLNALEMLNKMFETEILEEDKKKDDCYDCPYGKHSPCIGFCLKTILKEVRKE